MRAAELQERAECDRRRAAMTGRQNRLSLASLLGLLRLKKPSVAADIRYTDVRIRYASPSDDAELRQLAALDSAEVPGLPLLVAEVEGELYAAMSLSDQRVIADPFRHTQSLLELLAVRAAQIRAATESLPQYGRTTRWKLAPDSRKRGL